MEIKIPDYTFLIQFAIFIVLMIVLSRIFFKPLLEMLDRREKLVTGPNQSADRMNKEGGEISGKYREQLAAGLAGAEDLKSAQFREAGAREKAILQEAREALELELTKSREDLARARDRVLDDLSGQVGLYSKEIAETILGRAM